MAFAAFLAELHAEASCPLCQDYLRDPVTLDCGHNFCESCIEERWKDLEDVFPCPVCLHHCPDRNFRRNHQLCDLTDNVKQLPVRRTKWKLEKAEFLCETHKEVLDLFCEEDLEPLCPQCRVSSDHQGHRLTPTEDALVSQRKRLKGCMKILGMQIDDVEETYKLELLKSFKMKEDVENWKTELEIEFEEMNYFLKKEQISINANLLSEMKDIGGKHSEHKRQIAKYLSTVNNLLREVTIASLQTDLDFLRSVGGIHDKYEQLSAPENCSYECKKITSTLPPHYFGLQNMISKFQVDLTLNPNTAHSCLTVSKDRRSVTLRSSLPSLPESLQKYIAYPAVLSCQSFDSGRHFWQVDIRGAGEWVIGICTNSVFRNHQVSPVPKSSFWSFQYTWKLSQTKDTEPELQVAKLGVFLDFELGEYSVYDLYDRACLHKFTGVFTGKVTPYFAIRPDLKEVSISLAAQE